MDMAEATTRVRDKPSKDAYAQVALVRTKVAEVLARSQECLVARIRFQSRLALRSEYFLSFDVPKPRLAKGEIEAVIKLVKAQVADMLAVFESLDDVPYRDRTLPNWRRARPASSTGCLPACRSCPSP